MIRRLAESRFTSPARATVGPPRLRAFSRRVKRKRDRACVVCGAPSANTAHLIAVSEAPQLAIRERNAVRLCRLDHLLLDSWIGVIQPGSPLYVTPLPRLHQYLEAFLRLKAARDRLCIAYGLVGAPCRPSPSG